MTDIMAMIIDMCGEAAVIAWERFPVDLADIPATGPSFENGELEIRHMSLFDGWFAVYRRGRYLAAWTPGLDRWVVRVDTGPRGPSRHDHGYEPFIDECNSLRYEMSLRPRMRHGQEEIDADH